VLSDEFLQGHETTAICRSTDGADLYRMDKEIFVELLCKQQKAWSSLTEKSKHYQD